MGFAQKGSNGPAEIPRGDVLALTVRLEEADNRRGGETVRRNGEAVPDLGRTTAVVPVGDATEVESLDEGRGAAQTQAKQGVQAQSKAVLPIRKDLRRLGLAGWPCCGV